jgi:hypothetical protein
MSPSKHGIEDGASSRFLLPPALYCEVTACECSMSLFLRDWQGRKGQRQIEIQKDFQVALGSDVCHCQHKRSRKSSRCGVCRMGLRGRWVCTSARLVQAEGKVDGFPTTVSTATGSSAGRELCAVLGKAAARTKVILAGCYRGQTLETSTGDLESAVGRS